MTSAGNNMSEEENELLSIILVTSGTRGERLLFKYPFDTQERQEKGKGTYVSFDNI